MTSSARSPRPSLTWSQVRGRRGDSPLLLAHRGASAYAPENTRPALQLAIRQGADGVEVDVQPTSDGVPVLVHDDDWWRTAGEPAPVRDLGWDAVRRLDAGSWFAPEFRGVPPGTLEDALEIAGSRLVNLEIKSPRPDDGLAQSVATRVRRLGLQSRVLFTSFDHACIDALARSCDDLELGYLVREGVGSLPRTVRTLVLHFDALLARPEIARQAHADGRCVLAYTVDDPATAKQLRRVHVDGIITNDPAALRDACRPE